MLDKIWNVNNAIMCTFMTCEWLWMKRCVWKQGNGIQLHIYDLKLLHVFSQPINLLFCIGLFWFGFGGFFRICCRHVPPTPSCEMQIPLNRYVHIALLLGFSVGLEEVSSFLLKSESVFDNRLFLITHFMSVQITFRKWCSLDWRPCRKILSFLSLGPHFRTLFPSESQAFILLWLQWGKYIICSLQSPHSSEWLAWQKVSQISSLSSLDVPLLL